MAKQKPMLDPTVLFWLTVGYHVFALVKDEESFVANWRNYKARPTGANLVRLLVAEGVFIKDLGLAA